MPPRIAKLAGLGAYGACAGMVAVFALLIAETRPAPQDGITPVLSYVTWLSLGVVFAALIGAHIVIARQLMHLGNDGDATEA